MGRRRRKLPRDPVQARVDRISHEGRGITQIEGKTTFIEGALPGEQVLFKYTDRRRSFDEGAAIEIQEASAERVETPCEHAALCGGCSLQHWNNEAQIQHKQSVLLEQLQHFGAEPPQELLEPMLGDTLGYRRKARLAVKYVPKKGGVLVGFREKRSPYVADIQSCAVLTPKVGQRLVALRELIESLSIKDKIPQIEVAEGDDDTALVFRHLEPFSSPDVESLVKFGESENFHIYLQPKGEDSVHRLWPQAPNGGQMSDPEARLHYRLDDFDLSLTFHPMDFTQVNASINRQMVTRAIEFLDIQPHHRVLDLFSGLGNFTLAIAKHAASVVGVEGGSAMVERGMSNAALNGLSNVQCFAANLDQPVDEFDWAQQQYDRILIDPPRSGAQALINDIKRFNAQRIVYVSCNPATLARDAGLLREQGYTLKKAGVMDMFPHTAHVESIAVFDRDAS